MASQVQHSIGHDLKSPEKTTIAIEGDLEAHSDRTPLGDDEVVDSEFQRGVQDIEAVTIEWSRAILFVALGLIWLLYFVQGLVSGVSGAVLPYVTSSFAEHSLTPTTSVLSFVIGGVTNLSIAKILDVVGRPHGFLFCVGLCTIGLIMAAACNTVEAYAASQVFYTVGINGFGYSLSVFVADITTLRNRGLVQALVTTPYLVTAWIGGPVSTAFLQGAGWRWAFGANSIILPVVALPLFVLFVYQQHKAKAHGILPSRVSGRTLWQSAAYYFREFDVVGLLLLSAGLAFLLLPFNLVAMQSEGWSSALVISFLVVGFVLLIFFGLWARFSPWKSFIPWALLRDRTVVGACVLAFASFVSANCWLLFLSSILQVVNNLSVTEASYVVQIQTVCGLIFSIITGAVIAYTGRFKPLSLYAITPLSVLGIGLMIHFRQPDAKIGYIVMSQIFIAAGSGIIMLADEIAILAAVKEQQYFAIGIALVSAFSSIGSAVGLTISAAIWQTVLPQSLALYLPEEELPNLPLIYADINTQLAYPTGSPARLAIQYAYGDAQKYLFTAAAAWYAVCLVGILLWRDIDVKKIKQTKGRVV